MKKTILLTAIILGSINAYSQNTYVGVWSNTSNTTRNDYSQLHTYVGVGSTFQNTSTVERTNPQYRVTAYSKIGSDLEKISIKIEIAENALGQDEIYVVAYYDNYLGRWNELSYKKPVTKINKVYANTYEERNFDYMVFIGSGYTYFNI